MAVVLRCVWIFGTAVALSCGGRSLEQGQDPILGTGGTHEDESPRAGGGGSSNAPGTGATGGRGGTGGAGAPMVAGGPSGTGGTGDMGLAGTSSAAGDAGESQTGAEECVWVEDLPTLSTWEPWFPPAGMTTDEMMAALRDAMVGYWHGIETNPWNPPHEVDVHFTDNGQYGGFCSRTSYPCCAAFYWGTELDTELKQFRLTAVLNGKGFGILDMIWWYPPDEPYIGWPATLTEVERDASGNGLRFHVEGELEFDLRRARALPTE